MPNRIVRESILRSRKVNQLTWGAECFYRRLINVVDDYGLYYADTGILRRDLYPRTDNLTTTQVGKWARECVDSGLLTLYGHDGDFYLMLHGVDAPRAKKSKHPMPSADICKQMISDASKCPVVVVVDVNVKQPSPSGDDGPPADFVEFWNHYPRKIGKGAALKVWKRMNVKDRKEAIEQAEAYSQAYDQAPDGRRQFFKHPTTWLNARGWEDDHGEWRLLIEGK